MSELVRVEVLAPSEQDRLAELEVVVERGMQTFVDVGLALMEIRDVRLYRETHDTFKAYCEDRFSFSDSRGRQLIAAARTVTAVTLEGLPAPATEGEARELARMRRRQAARREREEALRAQRETVHAGALRSIEVLRSSGIEPWAVEVADVRTWRPEGVNCIITDPPYVTDDAIELYSALADFAVDALPDGGALVAMTWGPMLLDVAKAMDRSELVFRSPITVLYENTERTPDRAARVFDGWKPVLVFHKGAMPFDATYFNDVISSPAPAKEHHEWGQSPEVFERLVGAFSNPGDVVCDPFLGGGTTAVAALALARRFVGADVDAAAITTTMQRLVA